jgi:hypothetical protein
MDSLKTCVPRTSRAPFKVILTSFFNFVIQYFSKKLISQINLKNIMLNERIFTQASTYYMI